MKKIIIWTIILIIISSYALAGSYEENYTQNLYLGSSENAQIRIDQLKYEPYPVNPGEYFDLWIKVENIGQEYTENATFELITKYPFSLDPNEKATKTYGKLNSEPIVLEYKVRTSDNAVEGTNEIELRYKTTDKMKYWLSETFEIEVADAQTDFDLVIQEMTENEATIAIANIGKNEAYSVIIRIPEQKDFEIIGTNGQMVGNLEDGDYTLVSFEIKTKNKEENKFLKVQIDYTDTIGERRSKIKNLPLNIQTINQTTINGRTKQQDIPIYKEYWFWGIVIIILYILNKTIKGIKERKKVKEAAKK